MADDAELTPGQKAARRRKLNSRVKTEVIAHLPVVVDLTKRNSGGDLRFVIKRGKTLGTLILGRGSVEWWAVNAKKRTAHWTWTSFVNLLLILSPSDGGWIKWEEEAVELGIPALLRSLPSLRPVGVLSVPREQRADPVLVLWILQT
jgi:hypothetical protein